MVDLGRAPQARVVDGEVDQASIGDHRRVWDVDGGDSRLPRGQHERPRMGGVRGGDDGRARGDGSQDGLEVGDRVGAAEQLAVDALRRERQPEALVLGGDDEPLGELLGAAREFIQPVGVGRDLERVLGSALGRAAPTRARAPDAG